jgi:hypothetical protein
VTPIFYKLQRYEDAQKAPEGTTPAGAPAPATPAPTGTN